VKRLILAIVVSAGLFLSVGVSVADAAVTVYNVSISIHRVNGVTTRTCIVTSKKDGVDQLLTQQQSNNLQARGITSCVVNGTVTSIPIPPPTP
jgi:hypothetical protein